MHYVIGNLFYFKNELIYPNQLHLSSLIRQTGCFATINYKNNIV